MSVLSPRRPGLDPGPLAPGYGETRDRVEHYFDRTATRVWEQLTSDAPVSGIRATVRAGRDRMREVLLSQVGVDLSGQRILDAGCGTGALSFELAARGADVVAVDLSPELVKIAEARCPKGLARRITFTSGDMTNPALGRFDRAVAMDSMIYYSADDLAAMMGRILPRLERGLLFTAAPRTPLLMAMWRIGKLFPRSDRAPVMVPQTAAGISSALRRAKVAAPLREIDRISSGFYISTALEVAP